MQIFGFSNFKIIIKNAICLKALEFLENMFWKSFVKISRHYKENLLFCVGFTQETFSRQTNKNGCASPP